MLRISLCMCSVTSVLIAFWQICLGWSRWHRVSHHRPLTWLTWTRILSCQNACCTTSKTELQGIKNKNPPSLLSVCQIYTPFSFSFLIGGGLQHMLPFIILPCVRHNAKAAVILFTIEFLLQNDSASFRRCYILSVQPCHFLGVWLNIILHCQTGGWAAVSSSVVQLFCSL